MNNTLTVFGHHSVTDPRHPHGIFAAGGPLVPTQEKKNHSVTDADNDQNEIRTTNKG